MRRKISCEVRDGLVKEQKGGETKDIMKVKLNTL